MDNKSQSLLSLLSLLITAVSQMMSLKTITRKLQATILERIKNAFFVTASPSQHLCQARSRFVGALGPIIQQQESPNCTRSMVLKCVNPQGLSWIRFHLSVTFSLWKMEYGH